VVSVGSKSRAGELRGNCGTDETYPNERRRRHGAFSRVTFRLPGSISLVPICMRKAPTTVRARALSPNHSLAASAWVAPDATVCGDVIIESGARVLYGARLIGESGGRISIGANCIIMENAVIR
jgi:hypothetical protein